MVRHLPEWKEVQTGSRDPYVSLMNSILSSFQGVYAFPHTVSWCIMFAYRLHGIGRDGE